MEEMTSEQIKLYVAEKLDGLEHRIEMRRKERSWITAHRNLHKARRTRKLNHWPEDLDVIKACGYQDATIVMERFGIRAVNPFGSELVLIYGPDSRIIGWDRLFRYV